MKTILMITAATLLTATAAQADAVLFHGKVWSTEYTASTTDTHRPQCSAVASTDAVGGLAAVKYTAADGLMVQAFKQGWSIPEGTDVPFSVGLFNKEADDETFSTPTAYSYAARGGVYVTMGVQTADETRFIELLSHADVMQIAFPGGNEPVWTVRMDESRRAMKALYTCMHQIGSVTQPVATQPVKPTQPVTTTQPADKSGSGI